MNRLPLVLLSLGLLAFSTCGLTQSATILKPSTGNILLSSQKQNSYPMNNSATTIESKGVNTWLIKVEQSFQGESAIGKILVKQETTPTSGSSPYIKLALSKAWLALSESKLLAKDVTAAIFCAQTGLDKLGSDYTSPLTVDDTGMKLLVAQDRIQEGHPEDGAKIMLRMLHTRIELFVELHQSDILE